MPTTVLRDKTAVLNNSTLPFSIPCTGAKSLAVNVPKTGYCSF